MYLKLHLHKYQHLPVSIEVDTHALVVERVEEHVLLHHPVPQFFYFSCLQTLIIKLKYEFRLFHLIIILRVHPGL